MEWLEQERNVPHWRARTALDVWLGWIWNDLELQEGIMMSLDFHELVVVLYLLVPTGRWDRSFLLRGPHTKNHGFLLFVKIGKACVTMTVSWKPQGFPLFGKRKKGTDRGFRVDKGPGSNKIGFVGRSNSRHAGAVGTECATRDITAMSYWKALVWSEQWVFMRRFAWSRW